MNLSFLEKIFNLFGDVSEFPFVIEKIKLQKIFQLFYEMQTCTWFDSLYSDTITLPEVISCIKINTGNFYFFLK